MAAQNTSTELSTITDPTTETDTQEEITHDNTEEINIQYTTTETNTHTENSSAEADTGHDSRGAEDRQSNFTQPETEVSATYVNVHHTTAETDTPPHTHSNNIQDTSTPPNSIQTFNDTQNTSVTSSFDLLTQTTNILHNTDSFPQYAESHPLNESPHMSHTYINNFQQPIHNNPCQRFEQNIQPSNSHPQNWIAPSEVNMTNLPNWDVLTSCVNGKLIW